MAMAFEDFKQQILQNPGKQQRINIQGKQCENNIENQFEISLQQINYFSQIYILLHIEKISEEKIIQQLKELDEYKTTLLAKVAHDVRNPINSISYLIQDAIQTIETSQTSQTLECKQIVKNNLILMKSSIFFLQFLVNDLMDFCQYKQNKIKYVINEIKISKFLKKLKTIIEIQTKMKSVQFIIKNLLQEDITVYTDKNRLTQVILNLVSNAIKFTKQGGEIIFYAKQHMDNILKFELQDNGSGMSDEVKNKITEPFQSYGNDVNENQQGIGLGLHISPNQSFMIESKVNQGSSFSFFIYTNLEINLHLMEESETMIASQKNCINPIYDFPQIKKNFNEILIVDDDAFTQIILTKIIQKRYPTFKILTRSNGEEAIELFKETNQRKSDRVINLIFMDCNMPILDGYQASKIIKTLIEKEAYQETKIIGNSGIILESDKKKALQFGMDDLLLKPATSKQILQKIEKYL